MSDTTYWRNVANEGRGSTMTACLHAACDYVDKLEQENAEMVEMIFRLRGEILEMLARGGGSPNAIEIQEQARALLAKVEK